VAGTAFQLAPSAAIQSPLQTLSHVLTLARAPLASLICVSVLAREVRWGFLTLMLFVIADILDGLLARRSVVGDIASRRAIDSVVDRLSVAAVLVTVATIDVRFLFPAILSLTGSLVGLPFALRSYRLLGVVLKAPPWHRAWSILLTGSGLAFFVDRDNISLVLGIMGTILLWHCTLELVAEHKRLAVDRLRRR
jgi:phosphatidylglycerophosphate synthase